jgi:hypothetical protein
LRWKEQPNTDPEVVRTLDTVLKQRMALQLITKLNGMFDAVSVPQKYFKARLVVACVLSQDGVKRAVRFGYVASGCAQAGFYLRKTLLISLQPEVALQLSAATWVGKRLDMQREEYIVTRRRLPFVRTPGAAALRHLDMDRCVCACICLCAHVGHRRRCRCRACDM